METSRLTGHISRRFNKDIEDLRNSVLAMGGLVLVHRLAFRVQLEHQPGRDRLPA